MILRTDHRQKKRPHPVTKPNSVGWLAFQYDEFTLVLIRTGFRHSSGVSEFTCFHGNEKPYRNSGRSRSSATRASSRPAAPPSITR